MYQLLVFFHSDHDDDILGVDPQILQDSLVVYPYPKHHTVSTVLFHKYGVANVGVAILRHAFYTCPKQIQCEI